VKTPGNNSSQKTILDYFQNNQNESEESECVGGDADSGDDCVSESDLKPQHPNTQQNDNTQTQAPSNFTFLSWNIEGLINKLSDHDFVNFVTSFDVVCLQETFATASFDFDIHFDKFLVVVSPAVRLSRMGRSSGGTVLLVRKSLSDYVTVVESGVDNILCVRLSKMLFGSDKDVVFIGTYIHPTSSPYYQDKEYDCTIDELEHVVLSILEGDDVHFVVGGDLNARIGEWGLEVTDDGDDETNAFSDTTFTFARKSEDKTVNNFGRSLINFCSVFDLLPLNGLVQSGFDDTFTFLSENGRSVIDYFLCSVDFAPFICSLSVLSRVESAHMPIVLSCQRQSRCDHSESESEKMSFSKVKWDPTKAHLFCEFMFSEHAAETLADANERLEDDIETSLAMFTDLLHEASTCMKREVTVGGRASRRRSKWYDNECEFLKRDARRSLARYRRTHRAADNVIYKEKRNLYMKTIREKKQQYFDNIKNTLSENKNDSKKFWSTVRSLRCKPREFPPVGIDTWKTHFETLFRESASEVIDDVNDADDDDDIFVSDLDDPITLVEVQKAIRSLKLGKACGLDELFGEFFKASEQVVSPFLTRLFNKLYDSGYFPEDWTRSVLIPLLKKGDPLNPGNYRGISLLSVTSKLFTKILNTRLYKWAEKEEKICEEQAGFRKHYSTTDHIFSLVSIIQKCLNEKRKNKVYAAFIDYQVAFDSVSRESLWRVLKKVKMSTKMLRIIQSMYASVQACVRWGATVSDFFDCPGGLKQGCLLSPLIFSLLISEVADEVTVNGKHGFQFAPGLREIFLLLFADDIVLLSSTPGGLQNQLDSLARASDRLGLKVNMGKTKVMIFRKGGRVPKTAKWFYKGTQLEIVKEYRYLGFVLTCKLSIVSALDQVVKKGKGKVVELLKTMWRLGQINVPFFFKLFDAQVKPMLLYASEVWGANQYKTVESVQLFACKKLLSVSPRTPNTMAYGETGRHPLFVDSFANVIRYWFSVLKMDMNRIPRQAYEMLLNSMSRCGGEKTWAGHVKSLLDKHGFSNVWLNQGVQNEKLFLKIFKQRVLDCYCQQWMSKLNGSERFVVYRSFKSSLHPELYLNHLTISKFRRYYTWFRLGVNELKVNKRFSTVNPLCSCCNVAENELHFLFDCTLFDGLRVKYI